MADVTIRESSWSFIFERSTNASGGNLIWFTFDSCSCSFHARVYGSTETLSVSDYSCPKLPTSLPLSDCLSRRYEVAANFKSHEPNSISRAETPKYTISWSRTVTMTTLYLEMNPMLRPPPPLPQRDCMSFNVTTKCTELTRTFMGDVMSYSRLSCAVVHFLRRTNIKKEY